MDISYRWPALLLAATLAAGCAGSPKKYDEPISGVLVSDDGRQLVLLGKQYHYIFDAPPDLIAVLQSPAHTNVVASFAAFEVDRDNTVTSEYELQAAPGLDKKQRKALKKQWGKQLNEEHDLKGARYDADGFILPARVSALVSEHSLTIEAPDGTGDKAVQAPPSPVRAVGGEIVGINKMPLHPIASAACKDCD